MMPHLGRRLCAAAFAFLLLSPPSARADAPSCASSSVLGTSRTLAVGGDARLGLKTYPQTLDLKDHEVVLTFDDGPSAKTTPRVLAALEAQCVTATFFLIGRNASAAAALVRREVMDGDTVGHHTWSHPAVTLRGLSEAAALADIDRGMAADDKAAYGSFSGAPRVPFFRFPGFADTKPLLDRLAARHVAVFGADLWASDWIPMTPEAELDRLMSRLQAAGRGIILLHDTKEQTTQMLPRFLEALRTGGYHVVHVVPGTGPTPTRPAPAGWTSETEQTLAHLWPKLPSRDARPEAPLDAAPASSAPVPPGAAVPEGQPDPEPHVPDLRSSDP